MLTIHVTNKENNSQKTYRFAQKSILIGRQQDCDIILDSDLVSRRHAKINYDSSHLEVEDLGSGNGTFIGSDRVPQGETKPFSDEQIVKIQEFEISFEPSEKDFQTEVSISQTVNATIEQKDKVTSSKKSPVNADEEMIEIQMIKKVLGALDQDKQPSLTVIDPQFKGMKATLTDDIDEITIGRDEKCQLAIPADVVSRRHAVLSKKWGSYVISDLKSKNSTYVNGELVEEKTLKDGDEITFGTIKTIFKNPSQFDIESFTKQLAEEKKAEAAKLEQTGEFDLSQFKEEQDQVSPAAQAATDSANQLDEKKGIEKESTEPQQTKDQKQETSQEEQADSKKQTGDSKQADHKDLEDDVDDLLGTEDHSPSQKAPTATATTGLSTVEKAMLGFGAFVFLAVLAGLILLFL